MKRVLIVEDDANLGESLEKICAQDGLAPELATSLAAARKLATQKWDLVVLDWMLGDGQGIDFLKEIRDRDKYLPVIMLTARNDLIDKVVGLEGGANDYITKPFESRELVARIRVLLRDQTRPTARASLLVVGELTFNLTDRDFLYRGQRVALTKMEYELLKLLAEYPRQTFSRENLLDKVWGYDNFPTTRTVDNHVLQIRQKTSDGIIETIRGLGYKLGIVGPK